VLGHTALSRLRHDPEEIIHTESAEATPLAQHGFGGFGR